MIVKARHVDVVLFFCDAHSSDKTQLTMKKIALFSTTLFCLSLAAQAQITKGSLFLGGSFGVSSSSSKNEGMLTQESSTSGWSFSPQIGTAVGTNKIAGLSFGYNRSRQENTYATQKQLTESSGFSGGIFYRRYYPLSNRFYLFGQAGVDFGTSTQEQKRDGALTFKNSSKTISVNITPGISYAASRKLHLEASLNRLVSAYYTWSKFTNYPQSPIGIPTSGTQKQFGLAGNGSGFSELSIGLRWILPRS